MNKRKHKDDGYLQLQHKLRGLVSDFKSNKFVKGKSQHVPSILRKGIRELLLEARAGLSIAQFEDFLGWIEYSIQAQLPEFSTVPIGYDSLSGVYTNAPVVSLDLELRWVTKRIRVVAKKIREFRSSALTLEKAIFEANYELAVDLLEAIDRSMGVSFWSIQLRIAIEQQVGGLDRQKKYSADLRGLFRTGLLSFFSFNVSVRNEEKTTLDKFVSDLRGRIDRHQYYDDQIENYLLYRLARVTPSTIEGYADILRVEQSHSLVDLYETFISLVQEIVRRDELHRYKKLAAECIQDLSKIDDFRLQKAYFLLTGKSIVTNLPARDQLLSNTILSGEVRKAATISRRVLDSCSAIDPWHLIYAGFCFGHSTRERSYDKRRLKDIPLLLGRYLSRGTDSPESLAKLSKLIVNFGGLIAPVGISDFLAELGPTHPDSLSHVWFVGMNSPFFGIEDISPYIDVLVDTWDNSIDTINETEKAWMLFLKDDEQINTPETSVLALFEAASKLRCGSYQEAIKIVDNSKLAQQSEPVKSLGILAKLHAYYALGDRSAVIREVVESVTSNQSYGAVIPVVSALSAYEWEDYRCADGSLHAPIALHLLWSKSEASKTASMLRFSVRHTLNSLGSGLPSDLPEFSKELPDDQMLYFLRRVCVPEFMEQVKAITGTKMLMEERQRVCGVLRELDPGNADIYQDEIGAISAQQVLEKGQWIVDRSRIHVDVESLIRWTNRELLESYSRYRDLLEVDLDSPIDFELVLGEVVKSNAFRKAAFTPESESDAMLVPMLSQVTDQFINNSSFGLDFYLSKRIRHQSFVGLIRGPVEFSEIITTRESDDAEYRTNDKWMSKFGSEDVEIIQAIDIAFKRFARAFDTSLAEAKDKKFQIVSDETPDGLISVFLSGPLIFLIREVTKQDVDIDDFVYTVVDIIWAALEPSLLKVRKYIDEDLKTEISHAFDELRASVRRRVGANDPIFLELDHEIGKASMDVQGELDVAGQWFTRRGDSAEEEIGQAFQLEQMLSISIESAMKCHRTFEPEIKINVANGDARMSASTLVFLNDVMFVALDNVDTYSGLENPAIGILTEYDQNGGTLRLDVTSEVKHPPSDEKMQNLDRIQKLIADRDFERRTRQEGGSGFLKIAAVVCQRDGGSINFGFSESGDFCLTVVYPLLSGVMLLEVKDGQ